MRCDKRGQNFCTITWSWGVGVSVMVSFSILSYNVSTQRLRVACVSNAMDSIHSIKPPPAQTTRQNLHNTTPQQNTGFKRSVLIEIQLYFEYLVAQVAHAPLCSRDGRKDSRLVGHTRLRVFLLKKFLFVCPCVHWRSEGVSSLLLPCKSGDQTVWSSSLTTNALSASSFSGKNICIGAINGDSYIFF